MTAVAKMLYALIDILSREHVFSATQVSRLYKDYESAIAEFESTAANPITSDKAKRRRELTAKLDRNTINLDEAKELRSILEEELTEAQNINNAVAALAILFFLGLILAVIAALSK